MLPPVHQSRVNKALTLTYQNIRLNLLLQLLSNRVVIFEENCTQEKRSFSIIIKRFDIDDVFLGNAYSQTVLLFSSGCNIDVNTCPLFRKNRYKRKILNFFIRK